MQSWTTRSSEFCRSYVSFCVHLSLSLSIAVSLSNTYQLPLSKTTISALEFKRTTNSMTLADEKLILKEIHVHQRTKTQLEDYNSYERKVQEKKVRVYLYLYIDAYAQLSHTLFLLPGSTH